MCGCLYLQCIVRCGLAAAEACMHQRPRYTRLPPPFYAGFCARLRLRPECCRLLRRSWQKTRVCLLSCEYAVGCWKFRLRLPMRQQWCRLLRS